ncbi:late endosomal/lysosomal adaptor, MAPK and MTOR activator 5 [Ptiloglossa arizonensis]|uniref:late endosomal/lysosomal adaptor, MAPK and MTOR activator 5 n=1 Tax=Ptiloglossa arizonensis TaxID=3350558 RepID=UPI003F9FC8B6
MERNLEKTLDDVNNTDGIIGCVLADHAGLCLGVKGNASTDSAGIIAAIADQVAKLEPKSPAPTICLQNDNRMCLIQRQGPVVGAIYKEVSV